MTLFKIAILSVLTVSLTNCRATGDTSSSAKSNLIFDENNCLDGQDMDADDVNISNCPAIPSSPANAMMGNDSIGLGSWELGTTPKGNTWKYGSLSDPNTNPRVLDYGDKEDMNDGNITCWAKGYYRLRKILQNPPADYVKLRNAGFQGRFFQFQSDLRNGPTGFKQITSYMDHLVKWVTVIQQDGTCVQPTFKKFADYAKKEVERRQI